MLVAGGACDQAQNRSLPGLEGPAQAEKARCRNARHASDRGVTHLNVRGRCPRDIRSPQHRQVSSYRCAYNPARAKPRLPTMVRVAVPRCSVGCRENEETLDEFDS